MPDRLVGFPPIEGDDVRVLVLGSMPSAASLRRGEYYGHPRNAFWPIMGALFGTGPELEYPRRARRLAAAGVAVWDVIRACQRETSADADIRREEPNDFVAFFGRHPALRHVFFNGGKSEQVYERRVLPVLGSSYGHLKYERLPSTSPALASLGWDEKLAAWRRVRDCLEWNDDESGAAS